MSSNSRKKNKENTFELIGTLRAWVQKPGKQTHAFWLTTPDGDYLIRLAKNIRSAANWPQLLPQLGDSVRVIGRYKPHKAHQKYPGQPELAPLKFKAEFLQPLNWGIEPCQLTTDLPQELALQAKSTPKPKSQPKPDTKTKILVCQKSTCRAKGSHKIQKAIETHLLEQGLTHQVTVQATGCLGCCKKAPCMMMPDKDKHQNLKPADVPKIMSAYF